MELAGITTWVCNMNTSRRSFLAGAAACFAAPSLVHASNLMPLRGTPLVRLPKAELLDQFGNVVMTTFKIERDQPHGVPGDVLQIRNGPITYTADFQNAPRSMMIAGWRFRMPEIGWVKGDADAPMLIDDYTQHDRLATIDRGVGLDAWSLQGARPRPVVANDDVRLSLSFDPLAFGAKS